MAFVDTSFLDVMRFVLAFVIFVGHYAGRAGWNYYPGGSFAVSGFFAIAMTTMTLAHGSELEMSSGNSDTTISWSSWSRASIEFVLKRAARLLPLYYTATIVHQFLWPGQSQMDRLCTWLFIGCWIGYVPSHLWFIQTLLWMYTMFPGVCRYCRWEGSRSIGYSWVNRSTAFAVKWTILSYLVMCFVFSLSYGVFSHTTITFGAVNGELWIQALYIMRLSPLSRLPAQVLSIFATRSLLLTHTWRPHPLMQVGVLATILTLWILALLDLPLRGFRWILEYVSLPIWALAVPMSVHVGLQFGCGERISRIPLLQQAKEASTLTLSLYVWQVASLELFQRLVGPLAEEGRSPYACLMATGGQTLILASLSRSLIEQPSNALLRTLISKHFSRAVSMTDQVHSADQSASKRDSGDVTHNPQMTLI